MVKRTRLIRIDLDDFIKLDDFRMKEQRKRRKHVTLSQALRDLFRDNTI